MVSYTARLTFFVLFNLITSLITYAKPIEQKKVNFPINLELLLKGEIPFHIFSISSQEFSKKYPDLLKFDTLSMSKQKDTFMVFSKIEYIVNRPVGLFDHEKLMDLDYVSHIFKDHKIKSIDKDTYLITTPDGDSFKMQSFFDSENMSTLNKFKVLGAANAAREFDIISESASTMVITEKTNFPKTVAGEVSISSFIPITEHKTLVISYKLIGLKKPYKKFETIKTNILKEFEILRELQNNFKDKQS